MNWPFALRSTVKRLEAKVAEAEAARATQSNHANDWYDRALNASSQLLLVQKRLTEVIDGSFATPESLAQVFENWDSKQQATFFNLFGARSREWKPYPRCMQFAHIQPELDEHGKDVLKELGQYTE